MPAAICSVLAVTDHRDRFRVGRCGKYERTPETITLTRERLRSFWADPENRQRQSELTKARMSRPGVSDKISAATRAALAARRSQVASS
jgi:hypothetical protein